MRVCEQIGRQPETRRLVLDNILLATDFSHTSEVGLRYALALARRYESKIHMVPAVTMGFVEAIAEDARRRALHESHTQALTWVAQIGLSGLLDGVRHQLHAGEVKRESRLRSLETLRFDLAVNGAGYRSGQTVLLDPAVEEVIRSSGCPVLTMSTQSYGSADGEMQNILYATDFSAESLEASRYALSLAQEFQARLTLLHVVEGVEPTLQEESARIAKPYKLWLGKLVPDEARLWCELEFVVEFGRPAEHILKLAWESHADLVILGARGLDRLTEPGQNVRKVMFNARCPVLTVSGALASDQQERFWRAAAAASGSDRQETLDEAS